MSNARRPKQAVNVVLLRPTATGGFEVWLTRDPDDTSGLGDMTAFPGDTVMKEDCSPAMLRRCRGLSGIAARNIIGARFTPQEALGSWIAGIRALFQEVGVLLAVDEAGQDIVPDPARKIVLQKRHAALLAHSLSFQSLLEKEEVWGDTSRLLYFSFWQSRPQAGMRFDTRFYLIALPRDQSPISTLPRVVNGFWLTPDRALRLADRRELPMAFPTFASLRTLADFESMESLLKEYGSGRRDVS